MPKIRTSYEAVRKCGYRKPGGFYLVSRGEGFQCGRLPVVLDVCPTCHGGIKFSRGWTWVNGNKLLEQSQCNRIFNMHGAQQDCLPICPLSSGLYNSMFDKVGLLWVGEANYDKEEFVEEAFKQGISRRIATVPHGFRAGETWVFLAHKKGMRVSMAQGIFKPAIFYIFRPDAVEYVVKGDETEETLEKIEKRGIELVKVVPSDRTQLELFLDATIDKGQETGNLVETKQEDL